MSSAAPPAPSTSAFVTALVTDIILFIAVVGVFSLVFSKEKNQWLYQQRLHPDRRKKYIDQPPPLQNGRFTWIKQVIQLGDDVLLRTAGLDALMYVYFFMLNFITFALFSVLSICIILPVDVTAPGAAVLTGFDTITMSTMGDNDPRLAAHLICFCVLAAMYVWMCYKLYLHFLGLRRSYLRQAQLMGNELTLMIRDLPDELNNEQKMTEWCQSKWGDTLKAVYLPRDLKKLHVKLQDRREYVDKLESVIVKEDKNRDDGKEKNNPIKQFNWTIKFWQIRRVVARDYNEQKIEELNTEIAELLDEAKDAKLLNTVFITLYSSVAYSRAIYHKTMEHDGHKLAIERAPLADDLFYPNIGLGKKMRFSRHKLMTIMLWALVFLWTIPIGAISAVTTLSNLEKLAPGISVLTNISPVVNGLIEGFLPSLALIIFQALLPSILTKLSQFGGYMSQTRIEKSVFSQFYDFQFVNFYLTTILVGLLLNVINQVINDPGSIPTLFGQSFPLAGTTFLNYIMIRALTFWPLQLLNIGKLIVGTIKIDYLASTDRQKRAARQPTTFRYGTVYPLHLLVVIIGLGYAVLNPLIPVFAALYFGIAYFITRYQLIYSQVPTVDSGGEFFSLSFNRQMASLIIAECTLIILFGLKKSAATAVIMVVPLAITIAFVVYVRRNLEPQIPVLSVPFAHEVDVELTQQYYKQLEAGTGVGRAGKGTDGKSGGMQFLLGVPNYEQSPLDQPYRQQELDAPRQVRPFKDQQDHGLENDVKLDLGDAARADLPMQADRGKNWSTGKSDEQGAYTAQAGPRQYNHSRGISGDDNNNNQSSGRSPMMRGYKESDSNTDYDGPTTETRRNSQDEGSNDNNNSQYFYGRNSGRQSGTGLGRRQQSRGGNNSQDNGYDNNQRSSAGSATGVSGPRAGQQPSLSDTPIEHNENNRDGTNAPARGSLMQRMNLFAGANTQDRILPNTTNTTVNSPYTSIFGLGSAARQQTRSIQEITQYQHQEAYGQS